MASSLPGPRQLRAVQRDRGGVQSVDFFFTHAELAIFTAWLEDALISAGAWFSASWAIPMGGVAVRRFIGYPSLPVFFPNIGWRVTANVEVRGRSALPMPQPLRPLFLLHFDGSFVDVMGGTFVANDIVTDGGPNAATFTTDTPMFGSAAGRFPGLNNHVTSGTYPGLVLGATNFQVEGFVRPLAIGGSVGGPILSVTHIGGDGANLGPSPTSAQLYVEVSTAGEIGVKYQDSASSFLSLPRVGPAVEIAFGEWSHWALVSDETSTRLYVRGDVANESIGSRPYIGGYTGQRFVLGAKYTGADPPLETYGTRLGGDLDEMRMLLEAIYTGASITVPTAPFTA